MKRHLYIALFLVYLLLPVLFQTLMGFQSEARWAWEIAYLVLAVAGTVCLWLRDKERRGGAWRVACAVAAGLSAVFCQNLFLGIGLLALAITFCCGGTVPWGLRGIAGAVVCCTGLLLTGGLLLAALFGQRNEPRFEVYVPGDSPGTYATVTVTDPGAMGRTRYHAAEQYIVFDFYPVVRISTVTDRNSGTYDSGKYSFVIDAYFAQ